MSGPLLEIENLTVEYETPSSSITAVSDASLAIDGGEFYGLAGESGSGKSTTAKAIVGGLDDNGSIVSGDIYYKGDKIQNLSDEELNEKIRWKEISWIPQSSMNSLDPLMRISKQAIKIGRTHTDLTNKEIKDKLKEMFNTVGLQKGRIDDYPHQFSGGMQQRAIIALALFLQPSLIIADEPTTALDVIMQDQIFKYLDEMKEKTDTALLLITHDISVIFESCDSVAIMHASQIAEKGTTEAIYDNPRHPYTFLFKEAFPNILEPDRVLEIIEGHPPELRDGVNFCSFAERCQWAEEECRSKAPPVETADDKDESHKVRCLRRKDAYEMYISNKPNSEELIQNESTQNIESKETKS